MIFSRILVFDEKQIQKEILIPIEDSKNEGEKFAPNSPEQAIEPETFATVDQFH